MTDSFSRNAGVRQGDVLSTTLFNIYVNYLVNEIRNLNKGVSLGDDLCVSILIYADDIVLLAENKENLQCMLNYLDNWCTDWRMSLDCDKTKIVHFRNKRQCRTLFIFMYGETNLDIVSQYKYLGLVLNKFLDLGITANILSDSAGRALGAIIAKTKNLKDLGFKTYQKLFNTGVLPVLNYGAEIWGFQDFACRTGIQNRAARYYLGVHKFTPILALRGELGWHSVYIDRWVSVCRYWNRLVGMDTDRLTYQVFLWDLDRSNTDKNWCSDIRDIF